MPLHKRILAAATAIALALGMAAGGATPAMAAAPDDTKVWVCKYSGTPGVNEQYKDGKNPIEVSVSTIDDTSDFDPVTGTGYFPDSQGRSYSLGYSSSFTGDPTIEDCPRPQLPIPGYTVTDQTCETGGSIVLDESAWITYVVTNSEGQVIPNDQLTNLPPGTYTVTPTAVPPAILDDEFYDPVAVIDAIDPALCADLATASIAFTAATCTTGEQLNADGFAMTGATLTSSTVVDGVYTVVFTADSGYLFAAGDGVSDDRTQLTYTGTLDGPDLTQCAVASATLAFTAATCTTGEQLNPGGYVVVGATLTSSTVVDGSYTIVFTAVPGSLFPAGGDGVSDDRTQLTLTGTLDGPDLTLCPVATATLAFTDPTCDDAQMLDEDGFQTVNAELVSVEVDGDAYTVVFETTGDALFAVGDGVSPDRTQLTLTGTLEPNDERLCLVVDATFTLPPATCEVGEDWENPIIDADAGVIWGEPVFDAEAGTVSITFTATAAYIFVTDDGGELAFSKTKTVTLDVADRDPELCDVATASVPLLDATCELGQRVDLENISGVNASFEVIDDGSYDGSYEVLFTADEGARFAGDLVTISVTGDLADRDPSLCLEPTVTVPVIDPTCEVGAILDVENIDAENATWVVIDDGSESGTYEVEFTADEGYRFEGDQTTLTVSGELAGPNAELCLEAIAAIAVTDADCFFDSTLDEEGFTAENATYEITAYDPATREYEVVFTADFGYRFDTELDGVSEDGTTRTFSGTLDAADPDGDGCVLPVTDARLAFVDATCLDPEALDVEGFQFDSELAELGSVTVEGLEYEVVFVALGEDTVFFQGDEPVDGRVVSEDGRTLTFTGTLDGPDEELCIDVVVPPVTVADDCFEQSYTVTAVEGVTYTRTVNGLEFPVEFGDSDTVTFDAVPFDTVTVTATAQPGYLLAEGYEPFEYTYEFDDECLPTAPVTTASVTWKQADCLGNPGSFTLTNEPGVIWTVDGVVVEGNRTYTSAVGSTPTIVADLEPASEEFPTGFGWNDPDQQTLWNLVFEAAKDCLPTLALTGATNALGGLGIVAVLIMLAGTGLVIARRREATRIQG